MSDHIRELLQRNLQEVFGEGNAMAPSSSDRGTLHRRLRAVCAARHIRRPRSPRQICWRSPGDPPALRLHAAWRGPGPPQRRASRLGLGAARRVAQLHRFGCGRRSRWKDRGTVCVSRFRAVVAAQVRLDDHRCEYPVPVCAPLGSREVLRATFNRRSLLANRTAAPTAPNDCSRRWAAARTCRRRRLKVPLSGPRGPPERGIGSSSNRTAEMLPPSLEAGSVCETMMPGGKSKTARRS